MQMPGVLAVDSKFFLQLPSSVSAVYGLKVQ